jgi:hypothetical protein
MLSHDGPAGAGLQVKQVLRIPSQCSHASVEVGPLGVGHSLKALLPHGILLVAAVSARRVSHREVSATCAVCSTVSSSSTPMTVAIHGSIGLRGYHHIDLTLILAMGHRHAAAVDRSVPFVAELAECVVQHSRKTRAMLARGAKALIRSDGDVGVVVHVHLKTQP